MGWSDCCASGFSPFTVPAGLCLSLSFFKSLKCGSTVDIVYLQFIYTPSWKLLGQSTYFKLETAGPQNDGTWFSPWAQLLAAGLNMSGRSFSWWWQRCRQPSVIVGISEMNKNPIWGTKNRTKTMQDVFGYFHGCIYLVKYPLIFPVNQSIKSREFGDQRGFSRGSPYVRKTAAQCMIKAEDCSHCGWKCCTSW